MNYVESNKQRHDMSNWLAEKNYSVFGTLKFNNGFTIGRGIAKQQLMHFFNKLDTLYFGKSLVQSNYRIERAVFKHLGESGENLHYHFLAKPDADPERFCNHARHIWSKLSTFTMSFERTEIELVESAIASATYCTHEFHKLGTDSLFLEATHNAIPCTALKPSLRDARLLNFEKSNGLQKTKMDAALSASTLALNEQRNIAGNSATH